MDVDEMIIKASSTADEVAAANNGGAYPPQYQQLQPQPPLGVQGSSSLISSPHRRARGLERDRERGDESPRPNTSPPVPPTNNPYPPSYPASQSAPASGSMRSVAGGGSGSQVLLTTHVFAPVVTGAPTKKTKFPNTPGVGSNPSLDTPQTPASTAVPPAVPFPPTNAQGQRICRQCGMVGRYKDGKCVEKWGPGPMGPGTVCDRCRKKMKRVERRGTLENQAQLTIHAVQQQQQHQPLPRTTSHAQLPLSQSSDRSIHRTDTVLAHHATMSSSSSSLRDSLRNASSRQATSSSVMKQHRQQQHQPTPPAIVSLRDDVEEEEEMEGDQLPTSNVGRGGTRSNGRKSSKDVVDPDAEAEAEAEILGAVDAAAAGGSADGDGDADGEEADAEAELLEAVDAAEANSTSSGGGSREAKAEDTDKTN
ncbi:hypothetical protein M413DRAFT_119911 [Hebeloma cylindrosporum]|uniref:Uncharacterized protein n=1 Tax=Hebeloma cylindrosporum TaxID=76867 RepID=A0A0C3C0Z7_HEBCY|nr:hypothetical protein M413DRAFT_119911 [Hebeloma cylindrosporum h7]